MRSSTRLFILVILATSVVSSIFGQNTVPSEYVLSDEAAEKVVNRVLRSSPVIDGHNDLFIHYFGCRECPRDISAYPIDKRAPGQTDIPRWRQGGVGGQMINVYADGLENYLRAYDLLHRLGKQYPNDISIVGSAAEMRQAMKDGKIGLLPSLEGAIRIQNDMALLRSFYRQGLRSVTLAYTTNELADGSDDAPKHNGVSPFGKEMVKEMNRLGILVDISHVSEKTMNDVLETSTAPVIFSHSNARALCDVPRNVSDAILKRLKDNGGIIMLTFVPYFTTNTYGKWFYEGERVWAELRKKHSGDMAKVRPEMAEWEKNNPQPVVTVADMADQFAYVKRLIGVDHIGMAGDYDGINYLIKGMEDVSSYPKLLIELARRGWTEKELRKITGENFLRVFEVVENKAAVLQKTKQPSIVKFAEKK